MWLIKLVDINGDGCEVNCRTEVDTLPEAELIAVTTIREHLHTTDIKLAHQQNLIYSVWRGEDEIGVVAIRSL